jgi:hypothetical protein
MWALLIAFAFAYFPLRYLKGGAAAGPVDLH